ncbi:hypothetical protein [Glycomyces tenuis]|uniref:hypothetical protein n=1 Tax=Glycomyces tenuis TaxID=58116 RepID=UPI0003F56CD2|nr:hypothetical protein [Glycomyces tenuis]
MTDKGSRERSLACGNATVAVTAGSAPTVEAEPPLDEVFTAPTGPRDSLRERGPLASPDRQRSQSEPDEEGAASRSDRSAASAHPALRTTASEGLEAAIQTWERFQNNAPGSGNGAEPEPLVGRARSTSRPAAVKSTMEYPFPSAVPDRRAFAAGRKALGWKVTETALRS